MATQQDDLSNFLDTELEQPASRSGATTKDTDGIPYCVQHHCRMKQTSGGKSGKGQAAYYACPVYGCHEKGKRIKTARESIVPSEPTPCPRCSPRDKRPVFCSRDAKLSTAAYTVLTCPSCGWKSNTLVRPELAEADLQRRGRSGRNVEELGAR